jgi:hypothetical protein
MVIELAACHFRPCQLRRPTQSAFATLPTSNSLLAGVRGIGESSCGADRMAHIYPIRVAAQGPGEPLQKVEPSQLLNYCANLRLCEAVAFIVRAAYRDPAGGSSQMG